MSLFCCPLCAAPLTRTEKTYVCPKGHSFDRSREGYVHLLPANQKHAKDPGDDKAMAAARNRFLSGGWYAPLRETLCRLALTYAPSRAAVLDAGCGDGYYTAGLYAALAGTGQVEQMAGVDLSKPSLRWAARREKAVEFAVASVYHLPLADRSVDLLLNCFSPLALDEFRRVLRPGGVYLYVVPAARHLWELKEVLYEQPYLNKEEDIPYEGFSYLEVVPVETVLELPDRDAIRDLFSMTPYRWKTPKAGAARLEELDRLRVTAAFRIHVFRRDPG
ncbi:putative RNA methyltransferase [Intestinimonas sp.]|uniref:putative RNA methyltransferase n=1 Tax=Intestinimonas sp. TaxID=1965293 RepID=UPI00262898F3|nr:methyltransferase domain-containing protein [Intestinimonas sp.]